MQTPGGLIVYFIPSIVAAVRMHDNWIAICALNFILGWTGIGWISALIWAIHKPERA
ncbi:MAG: superinfection immunity protein [Nitrospira sp.]